MSVSNLVLYFVFIVPVSIIAGILGVAIAILFVRTKKFYFLLVSIAFMLMFVGGIVATIYLFNHW